MIFKVHSRRKKEEGRWKMEDGKIKNLSRKREDGRWKMEKSRI
ncbi:hypothetical protein [Okeania sp. SIO2C9]|nr:hypothetical protein [Okeania sp. SIO2C9]